MQITVGSCIETIPVRLFQVLLCCHEYNDVFDESEKIHALCIYWSYAELSMSMSILIRSCRNLKELTPFEFR